MKRKFWEILFTLIAALCLCFGLAACDLFGSGGKSTGSGTGNNGTQTEQGGSTQKPDEGEQGGSTQKPDEKHLSYALSSDESYWIVQGIGELAGDIEIPDEWEGRPVKEIAENAFANTNKVTSITVGANVETIGEEAFYKCVRLKTVSLGDKVETIPQRAFEECTALEQITIPVSVKRIEANAFEKCSALKRITYQGTVSEWASIDFWYSDANWVRNTSNPIYAKYVGDLDRELYIADSLVTDIEMTGIAEIKPTAFYGYKKLENLTIGSAVETIGDSAFYACDQLKSVTLDGATKLSTIGYGAFWMCEELQSITIPNSVTKIERSAFQNCYKLQSADIGDKVTYIGISAFGSCKQLSSLTLGAGVDKIDENAFSYCESLTTVKIPASVTFIGKYAFDYSGLQTAIFENPIGWKVNKGIGTVKYVDIEGLEDPETAAKLLILDPLSNGYVGNDWEKPDGTDDNNGTQGGGTKEPHYTKSEDGTKIYFGEYPQTEVKESGLKGFLGMEAGANPTSSNAGKWTDYGYYISGSVQSYMWYIDVEYQGGRYRGVYFTSYRPYYTTGSSSTSNSYQDDNGYKTNTAYWFKYEPIEWRILEQKDETALLMANIILDSQQYYRTNSGTRTVNGKTVYPNNYKESDIRAWLRETFYETAFDEYAKSLIETTTVDNSASSTASNSNSYACENTQDKVFLLSYKEILNTSYGFSSSSTTYDTARRLKSTDYAKLQGCWQSTDSSYRGNGWWWLRSPRSYGSGGAYNVRRDGHANNYDVDNTCGGVVPALRIRL